MCARSASATAVKIKNLPPLQIVTDDVGITLTSRGREKNLTMTKTKRSLRSSSTARTNPKRSASTIRSRKKDSNSSRAMTKSAEVPEHKGGTKRKEEDVAFIYAQKGAMISTNTGYSLEMFCSPEADRTATCSEQPPSSSPSEQEIVEVTPEAKTTDEFLPSQPISKRKFFPELLFEMINAESVKHPSLIRWFEDGRSFFFNTEKRDKVEEVMLPYFPHGKFRSLRRQLSLYRFKYIEDFKKTTRRYFHPHFHRGSSSQDFLVIRHGKPTRHQNRSRRRTKSLQNAAKDEKEHTDSSEDTELDCLWGSIHSDPTMDDELHFMPLLPLDDQALLLDDDSSVSVEPENGDVVETPPIKFGSFGLVESSSIERAKEDILYCAASKINIPPQQTPPSLKKLDQLFTGEVNENDVSASLFETPIKDSPALMGGIGSAFRQVASRINNSPEVQVAADYNCTDELCIHE